jgi:hypothetical protein
MKKKISELELYEVDYLVALAEKYEVTKVIMDNRIVIKDKEDRKFYSPTTEPSQSWPIIEREKFHLLWQQSSKLWVAEKSNPYKFSHGKTFIEASMRCYVSSIYGREVEI